VYEWWDRCLISDMLSDEGNAFAQAYLDFERGEYLRDYAQVLQRDLPSEFHVAYTEQNYQSMRAVIDARYAGWKANARRRISTRNLHFPGRSRTRSRGTREPSGCQGWSNSLDRRPCRISSSMPTSTTRSRVSNVRESISSGCTSGSAGIILRSAFHTLRRS